MEKEKSIAILRHLKKAIILVVFLLVVAWLGFFDTYSVRNWLQYRKEYLEIAQKNELIARQIADLEAQLQTNSPIADEVIERIAREQYGMRRPGETVYRIQTNP